MEKSLEAKLLQAISSEDIGAVSYLLSKGANPHKILNRGKTCLGEAAKAGHNEAVRLLIAVGETSQNNVVEISTRKKKLKCHKGKHKHDKSITETSVKCKNIAEKKSCDYCLHQIDKDLSVGGSIESGTGPFYILRSDGSSSDENRIPTLNSPKGCSSMTQPELEWDEDIGKTAPVTSEDEAYSSMYRWYAAILESTGEVMSSAIIVNKGIDQQDGYMKTALHYASEQGHVDTAKLLIDAGCKLDVMTRDGLTPLHVAVVRNRLEIVKLLIAVGSNVNFKTHEKMSPLHFASLKGFLEIVKVLINNGAHLEARDMAERTALYLASGEGHCNVVKYLIQNGANVNGEEIHGYTPLCEAVWQRYTTVVEILLSSGARVTHSHRLLHSAIVQREAHIVKMLTNVGGGINLHNDDGDTPLLLSVRTSQPYIARILLKRGANVNCTNSITGANALHIAVEKIKSRKTFEQLLQCLLDYNIDMNATSIIGDTALNRSLIMKKDHIAVLLIRYGADVNSCTLRICGMDNLSIVSKREKHTLARMLLKAGHLVPLPDSGAKSKSTSTLEWIQQACKQPLTLSDYCRIKIRRLCKSNNLFRFVVALPLPDSLKKFLMMEDEGIEL